MFGKSIWLDSVMGITDYGHRPVPNVYLSSAFTSKGTWNAAHFKNAQADQLIADYIAALDIDSQRVAAKKIQELLLDETPVVFPVLLQLPLGRQAESQERGLSRHRSVRPLEGRLHQLIKDEAMRPELRLRPHSL